MLISSGHTFFLQGCYTKASNALAKCQPWIANPESASTRRCIDKSTFTRASNDGELSDKWSAIGGSCVSSKNTSGSSECDSVNMYVLFFFYLFVSPSWCCSAVQCTCCLHATTKDSPCSMHASSCRKAKVSIGTGFPHNCPTCLLFFQADLLFLPSALSSTESVLVQATFY